METESNQLVQLLKQKKLTLALAESMTAGLASYYLSEVNGTSEVFLGGIVCYNSNVKQDLLCVDADLIKKYSAESQEVTDELAKKLATLIKADVFAAITGLAGPGGSESEEKPVGTVFISVLFQNEIAAYRKHFKGTPSEIKKKGVSYLFRCVLEVLGRDGLGRFGE